MSGALLVVRSKRVVRDGRAGPASIHIEGETIRKVAQYEDVPAGATIDDRGDDVVMPGLVDSHVHVNEPGRTEWEGFETATRAAAAGGVTTIVDMPLNSIPPTTTVRALEQKVEALEGKCRIDVGLWGGVVPGNAAELRPLIRRGALGFKCFLVDSGVEEFPHIGEGDLREALRELDGTGIPLLVHAELAGPIDAARSSLEGLPHDEYLRHLRSRPAAAEDEAIAMLCGLAARYDVPIHIVHLSSASALGQLEEARGRGLRVSCETTPHYLHFAAESIPVGATEYKCAPPIRERENRERLWKGLLNRVIDMVVSDHSPCTPELKRRESGDFATAWGGISSLQLRLPIVWTDARKRGASPADLAKWLSSAPAALAGLAPRKGALEAGADADLVVWNPEAAFRVEPEMILHRHKLTPYRGEELQGIVRATYLRGRKVFEEGEVVGRAEGRWVRGDSR
ncbi:MAG TPA: allantoinase AllB [Thermoanaerobaculia bacterium]|nr:allantoinase AllB [Thermoanaerobaculia bacterium]